MPTYQVILRKRLPIGLPPNHKRHPINLKLKQMKTNILYVVNKHKANSKGLCPITCRLTYKKERKTFSTGKLINPTNWNSKKQLVEPPEPDAELINTQLSLIRTKLNQAFLFLQVNEVNFDVQDIYMQYKGKPLKKERGVIESV